VRFLPCGGGFFREKGVSLQMYNKISTKIMEEEQKKTEQKPEERKVSKTMEAARRLKGSLIVNDPAFLL